MTSPAVCHFGILTASDRADKGVYEDLSGPEIEKFLQEVLITPWKIFRKLVPDVKEDIEESIIDLIDNNMCSVVITTGGTGPAARDVTPEATEGICDRMLPGFGEEMRRISLKILYEGSTYHWLKSAQNKSKYSKKLTMQMKV